MENVVVIIIVQILIACCKCTRNHLNVFAYPRNDFPVIVHEWNDGQVSRLEHQSQSLLNLPAGTA